MVRRATQADAQFLLDLVNEPDVMFWSGRTKPIQAQEHSQWLARHEVFIAGNHLPMGYGRLEFITEARVSFAVKREYRGLGVGKRILKELEAHNLGHPLVAYVHPSNGSSMGAFISQGYHLGEVRTEKGVMWQTLVK